MPSSRKFTFGRSLVLAIAASLLALQSSGAQVAGLIATDPAAAEGSRFILEDTFAGWKKTEADLVSALARVDAALGAEKDEAKRESLSIAKAGNAVALARLQFLGRAAGDPASEAERKNLQTAIESAQAIFKAASASPANKSRALYYSGLAHLMLDDVVGARGSFSESVKLAPQADYAFNISLLMAEISFRQGGYREAIGQFRAIYSKLTPKRRALALYRTGLSYLKLKDLKLAEKSFEMLAGKSWAGPLSARAARALGQTIALRLSEPEIVELAARQYADNPQLRFDVLVGAYEGFLQKSQTGRASILHAELMRVQKDPTERIFVVITGMKAKSRAHASVAAFREFRELKRRLSEGGIKPGAPEFEKIASRLEPGLRGLIKSYADTFSGQVKNPEPLTKDQVGRLLVEAIEFRVSYYPKSPDRPAAFGKALDVCEEMKDSVCVDRLGQRILAEESLSGIHRRARLSQIAALEKLAAGAKDRQYRDKLIAALTTFSKEFAKDLEWLPTTQRLTTVLLEDKRYAEAIPLLQAMDFIEGSSASRHRLLSALFETERYEEIAAFTDPLADDKPGKDSKLLVREAHLRLAKKKAEAVDVAGYETHVKGYLGTAPEPERANEVLLAYMKYLGEKSHPDRLLAAVQMVPMADRASPAFMSFTRLAADSLLKEAKFQEVVDLLGEASSSAAPKELVAKRYLAFVAMKRELKPADDAKIRALDRSAQDHLLSLLALTQPDAAISFLRRAKKFSEADQSLYLLSRQVQSERWDPNLDKDDRQRLEKILPPELRWNGVTTAEKAIAAIKFPAIRLPAAKSSKKNPKTSSKALDDVLKKVRLTRRQVTQDLKEKLPYVQLRVLAVATALEEDAAAAASQGSDGVPAIDEDSGTEPKPTGAAKEFLVQAEEYKRLAEEIDRHLQESNKATESLSSVLEAPSAPNVRPELEAKLAPLMESKSFTAALIVLDKMKELGELTPAEYHTHRARVLLKMSSSLFMKEYIRKELLASNQGGLIEAAKPAQ